jgi:ABC-type glycerol-3-phosphate transport system substrate-binding protein
MDIKELTKEIDSDRLAKSAFIHDPSGRLWGVAPSLNSEIIFRNREIDSSDCLEGHKDWEWDGFIKYADYLRDKNPDLPYICLLNGYISYLFNNGVTFVNPDTGKVNINYDSVAKPLEVLRDMIKHKITPVYSDLFNSNLFEQILSSKQIACWSGWNNQIEMMSERVNDFDILPFPANSNCKRAVYSELFSIMSDSMNYNICWEFIKYALSSDVQKKLVDSNNCFPVCKDIKPKIFSKKQFDFLSNYIDQCERRIEDYYIPFQSFFVIETGIDRWIKHGGKLNIVLKDIEHSCQWHIDNYVLKNNN